MNSFSPILFGRVLGLAAVGVLAQKLGLPGVVAVVPVVAALGYAVALLVALARGRFDAKSLKDNLAYANWLFAAFVVISEVLPDVWHQLLWLVGTTGALSFLVLGALRLARLRAIQQVDPADCAWFIPLTVAAGTAGPLASELTFAVGAAAAVATYAVFALSAWRALKALSFAGQRSLWYGVGGSAVIATEAVIWLPPHTFVQNVVLGLTAAMSIFWLFSVIRTGLHTHGPWSNLFSLCSVSKFFFVVGDHSLAALLFCVILGVLALDVRASVASLSAWAFSRFWQRSRSTTGA